MIRCGTLCVGVPLSMETRYAPGLRERPGDDCGLALGLGVPAVWECSDGLYHRWPAS